MAAVLFVIVLVVTVVVASELQKLRRQLRDYEIRLAALSERLEALQRAARKAPTGITEPEAPPPRLAEDVRPSPAARPAPPSPTPAPITPVERPRPLVPAPASQPARVEPTRPRLDWESLISVRGFAWLGGVALFLGAALFLHYAIQHGWITPAMRVAIGLAVGTTALLGGERLRVKAEWSGQATSGAGVAILYASLYAAAILYSLVPTVVAFAGMMLVTLVAGIIAVRRRTFLLALLGIAGGFLTPPLLSAGENRPLLLLSYVLLLDLGFFAVVRRRGWPVIHLLALVGTCALYARWAWRFLTPEVVAPALLAAALLAALFVFLKAEEEVTPEGFEVARAIPAMAIVAPFFLVLAVAGRGYFAVSMWFLVPYLLLLSAGAVFASRRAELALLVPLASALSVLGLLMRAGRDLFPLHRTETLLLSLVIPLFFFVLWRADKSWESRTERRIAAAIPLFGSSLFLASILAVEPRSAAVPPLAIFCGVHAALLIAMGAMLRSGRWILAAAAYWIACLMALLSRFERARLDEFAPIFVISIALFGALPFLSERLRPDRWAWLAGAGAAAIHFAFLYFTAAPVWGKTVLGIVALFLGGVAAADRRFAVDASPTPAEKAFVSALYGSLFVGLLTVAVPMLLEKEWITIVWAAEAAGLAWYSRRSPEPGVIVASWILAGGAFVRLVVNSSIWTYHPRTGTPVFNWYLYAFGLTAIAFLLSARWVSTNSTARSIYFTQSLNAAAGILIFMLVNIEIADFYSTSEVLSARLTGGGLAQDMTYSLAWGTYALVVLVLGIHKGSKLTRAAALIVLLLTIGKVFLHDLWDLGALYRVGSIVGLAIALLAVSYLTQRFVFAREKTT